MSHALLDQLYASPLLPELLQQAKATVDRELVLRKKFYSDITPEHKWEFINGEVIMHSPALNRHLLATMRLADLMRAFTRTRKCGQVYIEKAMTVFPRNDYEPDLLYYSEKKAAALKPDTLKFPIPDLIVEVLSPSTEQRDRGIKFEDYAAHGVAEYWIVDPVAESVELYHLAGETYTPASPQTEGLVSSAVIAGLEFPVRAIFHEELNLTTLRQWMQ